MQRLARPSALAIAVGTATVIPGFLVGTLALQIRGDLEASVAAVAIGVTVFFGVGALGSSPGGRLAERVGALTAMRGAALVAGACLLAVAALADSLAALFALLAVAGLGNAVSQPAINLFMAEQVPLDRQGIAFGIKQSAIPAAVLVSGLALPALALPLGWRPTFAIVGAGALAVAAVAGRQRAVMVAPPARESGARMPRSLVLIAVGAALASAGPNALGTYLVASAVDVGIAEGTAGLLAALGSGVSLLVRVAAGARADRRGAYGFAAIVGLLAAGAAGFALMAADAPALFVIGAVLAFALGWGWPGLFNLAVVERHRASPGAATGISQTGIYVGAAAGPALYGLAAGELGYSGAWALVGGLVLLAALTIGLASRA